MKSKGSANRALVRSRLPILQLGFGALFLGAVVTQARVQLFDRDAVLKAGKDSNRFYVTRSSTPERGRIVSIDGKPLAQERSTKLLSINFRRTPKSRGFFMDLSAATGISAAEFSQFSDSQKTIDWTRDFSPEQLAKIAEVKKDWRADGVGTQSGGARSYPLGEAAAGIVGFMQNGAPKGGLELMQNALLKGEGGETKGMVDRQGQFLPTRIVGEKAKQDGDTLTLTLDADLQRKAFEAVRDSVIANKADQGVAIVMRPGGDVLAMASYPTFDPNKPLPPVKPGGRSADFSPAYQAALEPGSTFKILTLAKALDAGVVGPNTATMCPGQITVSGKLVRCDDHGGHRAHGSILPEDAIARSCNVSAAKWALGVGYEEFVPFVQDLGLLRRPALGLPNEAGGLFQYGEYAKRLQIANVGFGQSINVPPIALCSAFCSLANEGRAVTPRLIAKIGGRENPLIEGKQVLKPETASTLLRYMRSVIDSDHGTGRSLRIAGYDLGGKTGTAQKPNDKTRKMEGGGYVANFVGFVPAEQPQAVILVMIDSPKAGRIYGADVAGPVFREVARASIQELQIKPSSRVQVPVAPKAAPKTTSKFSPPTVKVVSAPAPNLSMEQPIEVAQKKADPKPLDVKPVVQKKPADKPDGEPKRSEPKVKDVKKIEPKRTEFKRPEAKKPEQKKREPEKSRVAKAIQPQKKAVAAKSAPSSKSYMSPARRREAAALARRTQGRSGKSSSQN